MNGLGAATFMIKHFFGAAPVTNDDKSLDSIPYNVRLRRAALPLLGLNTRFKALIPLGFAAHTVATERK